MHDIAPFEGFPEAGLRFLDELAENNRREWFEQRKDVYRRALLEPARSLAVDLGERLRTVTPQLNFDPRANGGSLTRIYRDTRFSKDKSPYKSRIGVKWWQGEGKKTETPGFFVQVAANGGEVHAGMYRFPRPVLDAYRRAVADDDSGRALERVLDAVRGDGVEIGGEHYKRVPRGYDKEHPRADLLRYNGLYTTGPAIPRELLLSADLMAFCLDLWRRVVPMHDWLAAVVERA